MNVAEAYQNNPELLGSALMVSIYEALAHIPSENRVAHPKLGSFSYTSDGFVLSGDHFIGTVEDFEGNLYDLFEHFNDSEDTVKELIAQNVTDWRTR